MPLRICVQGHQSVYLPQFVAQLIIHLLRKEEVTRILFLHVRGKEKRYILHTVLDLKNHGGGLDVDVHIVAHKLRLRGIRLTHSPVRVDESLDVPIEYELV